MASSDQDQGGTRQPSDPSPSTQSGSSDQKPQRRRQPDTPVDSNSRNHSLGGWILKDEDIWGSGSGSSSHGGGSSLI